MNSDVTLTDALADVSTDHVVGGPDATTMTVCRSCNRNDRFTKLTARHYAGGGLCPGPVEKVIYVRAAAIEHVIAARVADAEARGAQRVVEDVEAAVGHTPHVGDCAHPDTPCICRTIEVREHGSAALAPFRQEADRG